MAQASDAKTLLSVIDEVHRLQRSFDILFADVRGASHLTTLQKLVLYAIFDARMPPTVPQIGRTLGHPRQLVQRVVNDLVVDGLLTALPNPHHKRASLFEPTAKAREIKRQAELLANRTAAAFVGSFSQKRCKVLMAEMQALRRAIGAHVQADEMIQTVRDQTAPNVMALL